MSQAGGIFPPGRNTFLCSHPSLPTNRPIIANMFILIYVVYLVPRDRFAGWFSLRNTSQMNASGLFIAESFAYAANDAVSNIGIKQTLNILVMFISISFVLLQN